MATQGLQIGVVLAERWGKDQAMVMMSVPIYLVKIFNSMDVQDKKNSDGARVQRYGSVCRF